jgi:hypothetical protein
VTTILYLEHVYYWFKVRLLGWRCFVCGRLFLLHTPWQSYRCGNTPLPIELTGKAVAWLAGRDDAAA